MSNFAERLVARSAGTPPGSGISVLSSRPLSRFEPVAGLEVEEFVRSDLAPPQVNRPIAQREVERALPKREAARSAARESPTPMLQSERREAELGPRMTTALHPPPREIEATPDHALPDVSLSDISPAEDGTPKQITQSADFDENATSPQHVAPDVMGLRTEEETSTAEPTPPRALGRKFEIEAARSGRLSRPPRPAHVGGEEKSAQPPAPTISIGKIEVQFLPQEPRVSAPRPQPERTRGFEAYARARRGEPR